MGDYTELRGWLDLSEEILPKVQGIIKSVPSMAIGNALHERYASSIELYQEGWHIGPNINCRNYLFFGAGMRTQVVDIYKETLTRIAALNWSNCDDSFHFHPHGVFRVDYDGYVMEGSFYWLIGEGKLIEVAATDTRVIGDGFGHGAPK